MSKAVLKRKQHKGRRKVGSRKRRNRRRIRLRLKVRKARSKKKRYLNYKKLTGILDVPHIQIVMKPL